MASPTVVTEHPKAERRNASYTHKTGLDRLKRELTSGSAEEVYDRLLQAMAAVSTADLDAVMTGSASVPPNASAREAMRVTAWLTKNTQRQAAELLGVSESRISRNDEVDLPMLDRLQALAYLFARVSRVIGLDGAALWFRDANPGLDGKPPIELFNTSYGRGKVNELVTALLYGDIV